MLIDRDVVLRRTLNRLVAGYYDGAINGPDHERLINRLMCKIKGVETMRPLYSEGGRMRITDHPRSAEDIHD